MGKESLEYLPESPQGMKSIGKTQIFMGCAIHFAALSRLNQEWKAYSTSLDKISFSIIDKANFLQQHPHLSLQSGGLTLIALGLIGWGVYNKEILGKEDLPSIQTK